MDKTGSFDRLNFPMLLLNLIQSINEQAAKLFAVDLDKDNAPIGKTKDSKMQSLWATVCTFEDEMYSYLSKNYFATTQPIKARIEKSLETDNYRQTFDEIRKVFRLLIAEAAAKGFLIKEAEDDGIAEQ